VDAVAPVKGRRLGLEVDFEPEHGIGFSGGG
jgi:hypothetical protein